MKNPNRSVVDNPQIIDAILKAKKILDESKSNGFSEIKVIASPLIRDGNPVLILSESDYKWFKEITLTKN
ncbi:MAG TPA: hypothetical protein VL728_19690 [Cyclobacteriaceae bacterium]|jgi:hypothetical protein|nr:hypothetical protein [Cyclobacteriaceae bacterium]